MKSSLRTKLLLSVGFIIFLVLGTSTFVHIQTLKRDYLEALAWRSEALAQSIVNDVVKMYNEYSPSPASFQGLLRSLSLQCIELYELNKEKGVIHFAVFDSSGNIAAHNEKALWNTAIESPVLLEHLQRHEQTTVLDGTTYHTLIPMIGAEDAYLGAVSIGVPKSVVDQKVQQLLLNSSGLFGLFLVLAFFAVSVLVHVLIAKPISYLVSVGEKIARGEVVDILRTTQDDRVMIREKAISLGEIGELAVPFHHIILYLQDMAQAATRIATGDLDQEVTPRSDQDVLGTAFQRMSSYLRNMASVATAIADGDLRHTVQPHNEHDVLGNAFHTMKSLHQAISQIKDETENVRNASESLSQVSLQMVSDAEQTSQRIQLASSSSSQISGSMANVSTSTEEMSASIHEIARNTVDVTNVMTTAIQAVTAASTTLTDLETRSQEIGEIINVITMITQQTNLLALNATIEAARAGETGKGFAVVAHEVKDLAREIARSAKDITHKVEAMQSGTTIATEAITNVSAIIRQMHEISHSITIAVEEQTATTNEISRSIADASQGSDDVTHVITDVATVTQNTMIQAKSVQQAAEGLASFADQLQHLVGKFQVERESPPPQSDRHMIKRVGRPQ